MPVCYHGHADGCDQVVQPRDGFAFLKAMFMRKAEKGIMILEDLTQGPTPYKHLEKEKLIDPESYAAVFRFIGHFHGAWWQVLNGKGNFEILFFRQQPT